MSLDDHARPLNKRGKRDAPRMSQWLLDQGAKIDRFISSTANRAKSTAEIFISTYGAAESQSLFTKDLYHADEDELYSAIWGNSEDVKAIALFAHNPGITYFANIFASSEYIDNVSTCGIVQLASSANNWEDVSKENTTLQYYVYPKKLFSDV